MRKLTLIAALIATTLSSAAVAADWVLMYEDEKADTYVDRESIRSTPNGYKRAWLRTIYGEPENTGITSVKLFAEYDCSEGRIRFLQASAYKGAENFQTMRQPTEWRYLIPDSIEENPFNYACFGRLPE